MQLKQLLYLQTVAETKSIRKASAQLFVSQQAISQSLQNLEEEYGISLLYRSVHGVALTTDGKRAADYADRILRLCSELEAYFGEQHSANQISGSLRIATIHTFNDYILPDVRIRLIKRYPQIVLSTLPMEPDAIIASCQKQEADLGFFGMIYQNGSPVLQIPAELVFHPFLRYAYCAAISPDSPLNNYSTLSVKSILQYPIVFLQEQIANGLENYMPYRVLSQFGAIKVLIADSTRLYSSLISANMGVGLASTGGLWDTASDSGNTLVMKPLRDDIHGDLGCILRSDRVHDAIIGSFLDMLKQTLAARGSHSHTGGII